MNIVEFAKLKKMVGGNGGEGGATVELDTTLTKPGKAAEAKAVGEAINRLANETTLSSDKTINLTPVEKGKLISVAIAPDENNALTAVEGGLFVPAQTAGDGIEIINDKISIKLADKTHGLVAVNGALQLNLVTHKEAGAMSAEDKKILDSIPYVYTARKYEITDVPQGTLVDYRDHEVRIMCPKDTEFTKQNVGVGEDPNSYYMTLKTYVPSADAVGYIEHLGDESDKEVLTSFSIDEHGRRYQLTQLALAKYDQTTNIWFYYGADSSIDKYIGWDYRIDWYNKDGMIIAADTIRINLSNEECHYNNKPYYLVGYATTEEVAEIKEITSNVEETYTWGEL